MVLGGWSLRRGARERCSWAVGVVLVLGGPALRYDHERFGGVSMVVGSLGERAAGVESVDLRGVWSGRQDSNQTGGGGDRTSLRCPSKNGVEKQPNRMPLYAGTPSV